MDKSKGETSPTLPGDIPGLLRRGSPVVLTRLSGTTEPGVYCPSPTEVFVALDRIGIMLIEDVASIALDLSDPTGAAHMAWWLGNQPMVQVRVAIDALNIHAVDYEDAMDACVNPVEGEPDIERIDILRRVVLHVANREPSK